MPFEKYNKMVSSILEKSINKGFVGNLRIYLNEAG